MERVKENMKCENCKYFVGRGRIGGDCQYNPPTPSVLFSGISYLKVRRDHEGCPYFEAAMVTENTPGLFGVYGTHVELRSIPQVEGKGE
uniref:Uncharacterized protein n=1 Tax=viral metagenome TaxID=1070528 RepID=A0A6M3IQG6_9ZZZZ